MSKSKYKVIGTRPIRHDGADKVTGRAVYGADLTLPRMAVGKLVRSPHPHAKIKSIDISEAAKVKGVFAIVTASDFPDPKDKTSELGEGSVKLLYLSSNCLARDRVLYKGQAVAAVAAVDLNAAEEAAQKIRVEYEPLPHVLNVLDAMMEEAPSLHVDASSIKKGSPKNTTAHIKFEKGDVAKGFAEADLVVEREFATATVHQGYIEPHVATAHWNYDGHLTIWTSTQGAFTARQQVADLLQIPIAQVTVVPCEIGGGFGGKITVYLEPVAAILSKKSGRPVKLVMGRDEVFQGTGPTPGSHMRLKLGAKKDGTLVAAEAWLAYEAGAFPGGMIGPGCMCVFSCYDIPHAKVEGFDVLVNKPKSAAYRAPGATQAAFACETVLDEIAETLKIDPIAIRLKNTAKEGTRRVDGPTYPRIGMEETLNVAKNTDHYKSKLTGPNRGRGIASGYWFNIGLKSNVVAHVNNDGSVTLIEGSTDIGGTRASIAMQMAETLGIAATDVMPRVADTDSVGYTDVTGGSRVTFATGMAAYQAGLDIIRQMKERAAMLWECKVDVVSFDQGVFSRGKDQITFRDLAARLPKTGGAVTGRASIDSEAPTHGFATHIVDVEVDPDTGKVSILRFTAVQDVGCAIHPSYVEGQMQGGVVQGIGWALNEEYFYDNQGRMRNASFLDYRMPTALDVPKIETVIVEVPNPDHPFGVRGVGEVPIVPPPAAIANAIHQAIGIRLRDLPMAPHKVWRALTNGSGNGSGNGARKKS